MLSCVRVDASIRKNSHDSEKAEEQPGLCSFRELSKRFRLIQLPALLLRKVKELIAAAEGPIAADIGHPNRIESRGFVPWYMIHLDVVMWVKRNFSAKDHLSLLRGISFVWRGSRENTLPGQMSTY